VFVDTSCSETDLVSIDYLSQEATASSFGSEGEKRTAEIRSLGVDLRSRSLDVIVKGGCL
jgi:hypothetical protein